MYTYQPTTFSTKNFEFQEFSTEPLFFGEYTDFEIWEPAFPLNRYSIDTGKNRSKYNKSDGGDFAEFVNCAGRQYDSKKTMAFQVSK